MNNLDKLFEQHYHSCKILANWILITYIEHRIKEELVKTNNQENEEILRLKKLIEELKL